MRVSTDKQAEQRGSQAEKMRAMALVHDAGLLDLIAGWWRVGQKLRSGPPGTRLLAMVDRRPVQAVITH